MAENSKIEWTDHTFNGWEGCTKVSSGCLNCYAETRNKRWNRGEPINWGKGAPRRRLSLATWKKPLAWNRAAKELGIRKRVFCASISDVFDTEVPDQWRDDLFELICACKSLDWLILTKRPSYAMDYLCGTSGMGMSNFHEGGPWDHVRIGTSAEDQTRWSERVPIVCEFPKNFVSVEPLLEPIDIGACWPDWIIVGGEGGPGSREMSPDWVRLLRDQCVCADIPFFFKQWGVRNKKAAGRTLDGKLWSEFPGERIREVN